jgi:hypothetical protein
MRRNETQNKCLCNHCSVCGLFRMREYERVKAALRRQKLPEVKVKIYSLMALKSSGSPS